MPAAPGGRWRRLLRRCDQRPVAGPDQRARADRAAPRRVRGIPVFSVENACASGSSAFNLAVQAIQAGTCDIALAVGAEKMNVPDKAKMFAVFDGGWDVSHRRAEQGHPAGPR